MRTRTGVVSLVVLSAATAIRYTVAAEPAPAPPARAQFHLYILAGQSNMAGVGGYARPRHVEPEPRVWVLSRSMLLWGPEKRPHPMPDPLWVEMGTQWKLGNRGVGPEWGFAKALLEHDPNARIGIIQIAASGSNIERWINDPTLEQGGGEYYSNVVATVRRAMQDGVLEGFLWHQGESNGGSQNYDELFERMVNGYRQAFGTPDLPVIAGTIGQNSEAWNVVNQGLAKAAARMKNVRVVSSIRTQSDHVHYDSDSQDDMGRRYADALLAMQGRPQALKIATADLPPGTAGTWYVATIDATGGDGTIREWKAEGLPEGMTLTRDTLEGVLPTQAAELTVTVSVRDASGEDRRTLALPVGAAPTGRIELMPSANFSMSRTFLMQGNRVLYVSPDAQYSNADRAYIRFDVPPAFRDAKHAALRLHVESAGNRLPVKLTVGVLANPEWSIASMKPADPATYPKAGATIADISVSANDSDLTVALDGSLMNSLDANGRIGLELRHTGTESLAPVILDSNRGLNGPTLVLGR